MPERIAAEPPSLAAVRQRLVYFRTLISHYARDVVLPGCTNSGPGTDTPGVCMDDRNGMGPAKMGDRLIDDTAPLGDCPTLQQTPWQLKVSGKEHFATTFNHMITVR
jgi:hypothetical protein